MGHLWEALCWAYQLLGFDQADRGDGVFRDLVLARIIEPTSKHDSLRVLGEVGVEAPAYPPSIGGCRSMPRPSGAS
jgi:hypothetical protein